MNTNIASSKTETIATSQAGVDTITKASVAIMGASSALIGLWAVACFASVLLSNGPTALIQGWFSAAIGV
ncbi:MAG: hypothetical protein A2511_13925 [Deltaproteobacteria bacterium RIFOXYD12_FULL_50_9]|nr:MAG: hypothetical protein A2511_13925 [Deltaproteobacteria bacterium RIFOXYD12_FULL_50_9]